MFGRWHWPCSVLDLDDVPSTYERTMARNGGNLAKRLKAGWRMLVWRRREKLLAERFSVLAVCSRADREYLKVDMPVHVIPNGFERPQGDPPRRPADPPRIGFIGLLGYPPNLEGMQWFARECWPEIKRVIPDARLRLVGRESDGSLKPSGPDIDGLGYVLDPTDEIATWSVMINPVRFGAGTRIKVAEAFSRKCPMVSTAVGAFGYEVTHGTELLLGEDPQEFSRACIRLIRRPAEAAAMAEQAWRRFLEEWTWDAISPRVWKAAEDCLRKDRPEPARFSHDSALSWP
jgi:glycosyltransferase involved in cell wall biosynthesis